MSLFDTILKNHGFTHAPSPLWKIKVTAEEFEQLRKTIADRTYYFGDYAPFDCIDRECLLYFAEWWRRKQDGRYPSLERVCGSLKSRVNTEDYSSKLYRAAKKGAKRLRIEIHETEADRNMFFYSMLYQGGLPMVWIITEGTNSAWDRFARGLVNRRINFDDLTVLAKTASDSSSLREFCEQLIIGTETNRHDLMPFHCDSEHDPWFIYMLNLAHEERKHRIAMRPFNIEWDWNVDFIGESISVKYAVRGPRRLSKEFLQEKNLEESKAFSIHITVNDKIVDTFDYINNYCRYEVVSKHPYHDGETISVSVFDDNIASDELDMSSPHILYKDSNGSYHLGNKIGANECLLLVPDGWQISGCHSFDVRNMNFEGINIQAFIIPKGYQEDIDVEGSDGTITFGLKQPLYWTEIKTRPLYQPDVVETLYDVSSADFRLCYENEDGEKRSVPKTVEFRDKNSRQWSSEPSFGEIFARCTTDKGKFVTPVRVINVGQSFSVQVLAADTDTCEVKVNWPYGHVSSIEGRKKFVTEDVWLFSKAECPNPRRLTFVFTPEGLSNNQFTISIKAPFKDFALIDYNDTPVKESQKIAFSDVDRYQYRIVGQVLKGYSYGKGFREVTWDDGKIVIRRKGEKGKPYAYEGSLGSLFESREEIRSLLEQTSKRPKDAEIQINFYLSNGNTVTYTIKDFPLVPRQMQDGFVLMADENGSLQSYKGVLKLVKLSEPTLKPLQLEYDEENGYILPQDIKDWGKTILYGRTKGRVLPILVDLNNELTDETRQKTRVNAFDAIKEELRTSKLGDPVWRRIIGWFDRCMKDDIPASSVIELDIVSKKPKYLMLLAFNLFAQRDADGREELKEQLLTYSRDLGFQWYWLRQQLGSGSIMMLLNDFLNLDSEGFINLFFKWASTKPNLIDLSVSFADENKKVVVSLQFIQEIMADYLTWLKELCVISLIENYDNRLLDNEREIAQEMMTGKSLFIEPPKRGFGEITHLQMGLTEETQRFFDAYQQSNKSRTENWLFERVLAISKHIKGDMDIFNESEEIRRSIIFANKSYPEQFILELNNKLVY